MSCNSCQSHHIVYHTCTLNVWCCPHLCITTLCIKIVLLMCAHHTADVCVSNLCITTLCIKLVLLMCCPHCWADIQIMISARLCTAHLNVLDFFNYISKRNFRWNSNLSFYCCFYTADIQIRISAKNTLFFSDSANPHNLLRFSARTELSLKIFIWLLPPWPVNVLHKTCTFAFCTQFVL